MADGMGFDRRWEMLFEDLWDDPDLKQRLLTDANAVLKERGIRIPEGIEIRIVENNENVEHLVLPCAPPRDELSEEQLEAVAGGACPSASGGCSGSAGCSGGGASRGSRGSSGSRSCRNCRSCRTSRGCRSSRP
jgi:hypothetical protein